MRKEWMKKYDLDKTWGNFKLFITESYFELKEYNELNNKQGVFMADGTTNHPHVEEAHLANAMNFFFNAITLDASNLNNLTLTNTKLEEQLKVAISQKQGSHRLTEQEDMRCHKNSVRKPERK